MNPTVKNLILTQRDEILRVSKILCYPLIMGSENDTETKIIYNHQELLTHINSIASNPILYLAECD